jgi:hypothetical protein
MHALVTVASKHAAIAEQGWASRTSGRSQPAGAGAAAATGGTDS